MDKETSNRVSTIASQFTNFRPINLTSILEDKDPDALAEFCASVRTLAGSAMGQDQTPGQSGGISDGHGIHPAPAEFTDVQMATDPILHFFHYAHLPPVLQATSRMFFLLAAHVINTVPRNPERTVALRKLLEAKDAAVRANLPAPVLGEKPKPKRDFHTNQPIGEVVETGGHDEDRDGPIAFGS